MSYRNSLLLIVVTTKYFYVSIIMCCEEYWIIWKLWIDPSSTTTEIQEILDSCFKLIWDSVITCICCATNESVYSMYDLVCFIHYLIFKKLLITNEVIYNKLWTIIRLSHLIHEDITKMLLFDYYLELICWLIRLK